MLRDKIKEWEQEMPEKIKCKLSMTSKDAVKMEKTVTNNDSVEV